MSFHAWLSERWQPEKAAIITEEGALSYAELSLRVACAARWLGAQGLERGDVLALQLPKQLLFLELHLAALALGITTLPLNDRYTPTELAYLLHDSQASLCVRAAGPPVSVRSVWAADARAATLQSEPLTLPPPPSADTIAVLCYTSGTTGEPKGALLSHGNLTACVSSLREAWRWSRDDVLVHVLPLYHVHGLFVAQHGALAAGATTVWLESFSPEAVFQAIAQHRATVFMGVPTFYHRLLKHPSTPDLSSMRLFTSGSAPLPAADHHAFRERFGVEILERYGMTEIGIVLSNLYDGPRKPGAVGRALPGVSVRITDPETAQPTPRGEVGEVRICGPSVFQGYLGRAEASAAAVVNDWMHTGDLGYIDEDGDIHLVGRHKDLIITGGLNVYPGEVEAVLTAHPSVSEAAVIGLPDADLGESVAALLVPSGPIHEDALRAWVRERLAGYKVPQAFRTATELPRNAMGKVQKAQIRQSWHSTP